MPLDKHGLLMVQRMGQISQPHIETIDRYPCKGWALMFYEAASQNDYFYVPDAQEFDWDSDFTVGFWFKHFPWQDPEDADNRFLISCSPDSTPGWGIYIKHFWGTYSLNAEIYTSGGIATKSMYSGLVAGRRYCVLFSAVESAGDVILRTFLGDGTNTVLLNMSTTFSDVTLAGEDEDADLYLGRQNDVPTLTVNADMDELHIWTSDVYAAIRVAWFNSSSGTRSESLGTPEAGYHCDWSVVDFTGNLHTLVRGPVGWYISPDLIHSPGCDINGVL